MDVWILTQAYIAYKLNELVSKVTIHINYCYIAIALLCNTTTIGTQIIKVLFGEVYLHS